MRNNQPVTGNETQLAKGQTLVSVTDLKGRIVYCNPSFAKVSGYARDELLGQPHNLVRHPDMPAEAFRDMWATLQGGRPWTATVKNRRKNGDHYWVRANACPMKDGARIVGYLSVRTAPGRDEIQQAEALYARMRQEAADGRRRTGLQCGRVVRVDPLGRLTQAVLALPARLGLPSALTLGLVLATGAAATWLPPAGWLPLALAGFAGVNFVAHRLRRAPLHELLEDVVHLAAGDLAHPVRTGRPGMVGDMQLALAQLSVNLRTVISDARTEIENLRGSAAEIAAGNRDLSARTESQAASLEQTAASMEQINSTVRQSAASAMQGSRMAEETAGIAQRSHDGVLGVVQAMAGIAESSQRIAQITHVIEGVAFQTNILALNAAVEAARAGEAGRGFAVVAGEVRMLARRTTEAAREITQLIQESGERVAAGDAHTQSARQRMHEALQSVGKVTALLEQISTAALEQQTGVAQVNQAVADLDAITQQNAAMVEQLSAGADTLDAQVVAVTGSMRIFRLNPGEPTVAELDAVALRRQAKADDGIDLSDAIARHQQWKTTLRNAALRGEKLDAECISRDDCCQLGQWLHGPGRGHWSHRPLFTDLLDKHAGFHREAGRVAAAVNAGHKDEAMRMLANATAFSRAGQATVMAIRALQAEAKRPQARMGASAPPAATGRTAIEPAARLPHAAQAATVDAAEGDWASF